MLLTLIIVLQLCFIREAWRERGKERISHKKRICKLVFLLKLGKQQFKQSITTLDHMKQIPYAPHQTINT